MGRVRMESSTARAPLFLPMTHPAVNTPRTKQSRVATMPVFREIKRGLQSRDFKMSIHVSMCHITLAYSTFVSK